MQFQCNSTANDLEPFKGDYSNPVDGWEVQPIVTLKEAVTMEHICLTAKLVPVRVADAGSKKKNGIVCSNHCHKREPLQEQATSLNLGAFFFFFAVLFCVHCHLIISLYGKHDTKLH